MTESRLYTDYSYYLYLSEEKLMGSSCKECGTLYVPPRSLCIACYSKDMVWKEMSGRGKLSAFTSISVCPPAMIAEGYNRHNPYCSGVVELEEGARVDARIEGVDLKNPESIKVGTPMKVAYLHREVKGKQKVCLCFTPS